jgi:FAST kinase domain-containing protein 2
MLLKKMDSTPLVEALIIAVPIVFNLQISDQIDHDNPEEIQKIFHHVTLTDMNIGKKGLLNIMTALALHGDSLSINVATSCMISLSRIPIDIVLEQPGLKLLSNCLQILNSDQVIFTDFSLVGSVCFKMIMRFKESKKDEIFYNSKFFNKVADLVIQDDLGFDKAYQVISAFNEIKFVNYALLDYIDRKIIQNESILKNMELGKLRVMITALSNANYKTENWEILKSILHENSVFSEDIPIYMPMLKMAHELISLGFVSKILLQKVFNPEFLNEHISFFSKNRNFTPLVNLRFLSQAIQLLYPEHEDLLPPKVFLDVAHDRIPENINQYHKDILEFIYGSNNVLTNITTAYGHRLDFVINFDSSKRPVEVSKKIKTYEELPTHKLQPVAIFFQSLQHCPINFPIKFRSIPMLRKRTLEKLGIKEIIIPTYTLESLPDAEKCAFVEREISEGGTIFES